MRICAIIAEYNPFHAGHAYHIQKTREISGCDHVVCLLSGAFVQRGEPAIFDKWHRAQAAVACGADLVLELPSIYALRSAEGFACGSVRILQDLNIDVLSFGSETDDIHQLKALSEVLLEEPQQYRALLKTNLDQGISYPASRSKALENYLSDPKISMLLTGSNAILGLEYLKALSRLNSEITPTVIRRTGDEYNDQTLSLSLSSATAIRKHIFKKGLDDAVLANVPKPAYDIYADLLDSGFMPVSPQDFFKEIIYAIRRMTAAEIAKTPDVSEGLENRIKAASNTAKDYHDLVKKIKTKRYTQTRIQRILAYILLGISRELTEYADHHDPTHIKVLAYHTKADHLMSHFAKNTKINLFHSAAGLENDPFVSLDIRAGDIYALVQKDPKFFSSGQDFTQKTLTETI